MKLALVSRVASLLPNWSRMISSCPKMSSMSTRISSFLCEKFFYPNPMEECPCNHQAATCCLLLILDEVGALSNETHGDVICVFIKCSYEDFKAKSFSKERIFHFSYHVTIITSSYGPSSILCVLMIFTTSL